VYSNLDVKYLEVALGRSKSEPSMACSLESFLDCKELREEVDD